MPRCSFPRAKTASVNLNKRTKRRNSDSNPVHAMMRFAGRITPSDRDRSLPMRCERLDSASQEDVPTSIPSAATPFHRAGFAPYCISKREMDETFSLPSRANLPEASSARALRPSLLRLNRRWRHGPSLLALRRSNRKVAINTLTPVDRTNRIRTPSCRNQIAVPNQAIPHIVSKKKKKIFSLGSSEDPHFVRNMSKARYSLHATRALTIRHARVNAQVVLAVEFASTIKSLHRDLKPANILVGRDLRPNCSISGCPPYRFSIFACNLVWRTRGTPNFLHRNTLRRISHSRATDIFALGNHFFTTPLLYNCRFSEAISRHQLQSIRTHILSYRDGLNPDIPATCKTFASRLSKRNRKPLSLRAGNATTSNGFSPVTKWQTPVRQLTAISCLEDSMTPGAILYLRATRFLSDADSRAFVNSIASCRSRRRLDFAASPALLFPSPALYLGAWILHRRRRSSFLFHFDRCPALRASSSPRCAALTGWQGLSSEKRTSPQLASRTSYSRSPDSIALLVCYGRISLRKLSRPIPLALLTTSPDQFKETYQHSIMVAVALSCHTYMWLRVYTRSSAFSLVAAMMVLHGADHFCPAWALKSNLAQPGT